MWNMMLIFCAKLVLFISLANAELKLIPNGKITTHKDGVTHEITKYLVVPEESDITHNYGTSGSYIQSQRGDDNIIKQNSESITASLNSNAKKTKETVYLKMNGLEKPLKDVTYSTLKSGFNKDDEKELNYKIGESHIQSQTGNDNIIEQQPISLEFREDLNTNIKMSSKEKSNIKSDFNRADKTKLDVKSLVDQTIDKDSEENYEINVNSVDDLYKAKNNAISNEYRSNIPKSNLDWDYISKEDIGYNIDSEEDANLKQLLAKETKLYEEPLLDINIGLNQNIDKDLTDYKIYDTEPGLKVSTEYINGIFDDTQGDDEPAPAINAIANDYDLFRSYPDYTWNQDITSDYHKFYRTNIQNLYNDIMKALANNNLHNSIKSNYGIKSHGIPKTYYPSTDNIKQLVRINVVLNRENNDNNRMNYRIDLNKYYNEIKQYIENLLLNYGRINHGTVDLSDYTNNIVEYIYNIILNKENYKIDNANLNYYIKVKINEYIQRLIRSNNKGYKLDKDDLSNFIDDINQQINNNILNNEDHKNDNVYINDYIHKIIEYLLKLTSSNAGINYNIEDISAYIKNIANHYINNILLIKDKYKLDHIYLNNYIGKINEYVQKLITHNKMLNYNTIDLNDFIYNINNIFSSKDRHLNENDFVNNYIIEINKYLQNLITNNKGSDYSKIDLSDYINNFTNQFLKRFINSEVYYSNLNLRDYIKEINQYIQKLIANNKTKNYNTIDFSKFIYNIKHYLNDIIIDKKKLKNDYVHLNNYVKDIIEHIQTTISYNNGLNFNTIDLRDYINDITNEYINSIIINIGDDHKKVYMQNNIKDINEFIQRLFSKYTVLDANNLSNFISEIKNYMNHIILNIPKHNINSSLNDLDEKVTDIRENNKIIKINNIHDINEGNINDGQIDLIIKNIISNQYDYDEETITQQDKLVAEYTYNLQKIIQWLHRLILLTKVNMNIEKVYDNLLKYIISLERSGVSHSHVLRFIQLVKKRVIEIIRIKSNNKNMYNMPLYTNVVYHPYPTSCIICQG